MEPAKGGPKRGSKLGYEYSKICDFCDPPRELESVGALWKHQSRDHTNVPCKVCGKKYPNPKELRTHMGNHEKKACEICGKMIVRPVLRRHMRVRGSLYLKNAKANRLRFKVEILSL